MTFPPVVMSDEETIATVIENRCSVARFGDGEYALIGGRSIKTQQADTVLAGRLANILHDAAPKLLICILDLYSGKTVADAWPSREKVTRRYGTESWARAHLRPDYRYGCAGFTRLCHWATGDHHVWWEEVQKIWRGRPVFVVTGSKKGQATLHNGMLQGAGEVLGMDIDQAKNAWSEYPMILRMCRRFGERLLDGLVLAALGPTATVLAADLAMHGIQCIDIGHMPQSWQQQSPKELAA